MPASSGNNIDNNNLVTLDFTNKDLLHFIKTTFKDRYDNSAIDLGYHFVETEENNFSSSNLYPSLNITLYNFNEYIHHDDSSWYEIYKNNLKKGQYLLTEIRISEANNYVDYSRYQRSYKYEDNKYIFNDWSEENKEQLLGFGISNGFLDTSILIKIDF